MKTISRALAVAAVLLAAAPLSATESSSGDRAATLFRRTGQLPVDAAGPYVGVGTYRIQVLVKLGRAGEVLPDGTWLYHHFRAEDSAAEGTLVLRFNGGRVSGLSLAGPRVVAMLRESAKPAVAKMGSATPPARPSAAE